MPTTNKTPNLGLNNWVGTDKPKRSDFVEDNTLLDTVLGSHMANQTMHLTTDDRTAFKQPALIKLYVGDGKERATVTLPFTPSAVFVYLWKRAMTEYNAEKGYTIVNSGAATVLGSSPGMNINGKEIIVEQSQSTPKAGENFLNLNLQSTQYVCVALR